ncbi:MAG: type VI secretion system Vgr family protein [Cellvibrionaceae bacterium]
MLDGYTQAHRLIRLNTTLGPLALIPESFEGRQTMSKGFSFKVAAFSETLHTLAPKDLVGTAATIGLVQTDDSIRYLNGFIHDFEALGSGRGGQLTNYKLTIVSWLEMYLTKRTDCRIFQNKKVDDVIRDIFKLYGGDANFKISLKSPHPSRRYWVQYNETDFDFFKRICRLEGLAYYFNHSDGAHQLHIVDSSELLANLSPKKVKLQSHTAGHDHFTKWQSSGHFATGTYEQRAYNYMSPSSAVKVNTKAKTEVASTPRVMEMESYKYGDTHHGHSDGAEHVNARANQAVERTKVATGSGDCRHLELGKHFEVELATGNLGLGGNFVDKGKTYTLTEVRISANDTAGSFHCSVEAIPQGELVYPKAVTPTINGLQTAVVTGPAGEEIYTDELGRIKVQFHWDRLGGKDENTTCWLRVMQSFAGPSFGAHFTPRIGQEVVVAFENGSPDRPFVIGGLYHPENPPPYAGHQGTRAGIRTRSTKGGSTANCNELYFEDKKGKEEVYFQAEKDHNTVIKNDETRDVGNNQTITIGVDKSENVGNNEQHIVGKNLLIKAGTKIRLEVGGSVIEMTGGKIKVSSGHVDIDGGKIDLN